MSVKTVKMRICCGRKSQLVVLCQVVTNPCCGLAVIFCGFISHLIGCETINIPEIFSCAHGFTEKTVKQGSKKVLSGHPGQEDFPSGKVTSHSHLPTG